MGKKMDFGVDAKVQDIEAIEDTIQTEVETPKANTPESKKETETLFGVNAVTEEEKVTNAPSKSLLNVVLELFTSQPKMFWLKSYAMSAIYYFFETPLMFQTTANDAFRLLNLVFFPLAVIFLGNSIFHLFQKQGNMYYFLSPTMETGPIVGGMITRIIWYVLKLMLFSYIWAWALVIGGLGAIITVIKASKGHR